MDPVIIVGAGPVGLALALALAVQEVPSVILDEGTGDEEHRPARTVVLRADTAAFVERLGCAGALRDEGARWTGWRSMRRGQLVRHLSFSDVPAGGAVDGDGRAGPAKAGSGGTGPGEGIAAPLHVPQHALAGALREALASPLAAGLVQVATGCRLDALEQDDSRIAAHTRGAGSTWWRGSHLVGCDGARSTVRKLLGVRFPGRTAVERHAVATLRTELPWPDEGVLHRRPPWRGGGGEVTARPLRDGCWRLDWLLPPRGDLVTPEALVRRIRETLSGWCGETPPYELIDTGVYTVHHRLARRWRTGRAFLAGDAAHLLGALGTQGLDEGLRDVENLAWKLARAWHDGGAPEVLLDSYQAERRAAVAARLRTADQALPALRGEGGLRTYLRGGSRGYDALLADGHLGLGALGGPPAYLHSPLTPVDVEDGVAVGTAPGAPVADVSVTAPDGTEGRLRDRLGRGLLVVLVAPGTGVWDRRHWVSAGVMPRLAETVRTLPVPGELLVTEAYPGAAAHTVLLIRPDGHLAAAFAGVRPRTLRAAARVVLGAAPGPAAEAEEEAADAP
ncbi:MULTISPECIES: FAD-dependent monooxygenase [Streptomyces]|uniref:FAD-dependent monooxygenase n=1 Tax=Streptomyces sudanensis TaxID=436397 RepID=A0ABY4TFW9_9ACTN|nr:MULTISPECIES: FAD-dependent monooxygenase [Streptomyces]URN17188.1 FAD-dependent monooxygenase [Streptomyces sudanensis]